MQAMMNDLQIPEARRQEMMLNLDQKQKIQLIQQHVFKKLNEKNKQFSASNSHSDSEKSGSKSPPKSPRNGSRYKIDMLHKKQSRSNEFKYDNNLLKNVQTRGASSSFAFASFSLTTQSLAIKRKQTAAKNSYFAVKHDKIMTGLVAAAKSRLNIIKNDAEIQQYVDEVFYVRELEQNDEEKELMARPSTARNADVDMNMDEKQQQQLIKASTIQFGAANPMRMNGNKHKYVCR
eukprot:UN04269